jgi:bifunctional non-homologous end joining protein LigD
LIDYYEKIAETMLPYIKDRPITMIRFPDGIHSTAFYQKDAPEYFPEWIERKAVEKNDGGSTNYVICNTKAALVYLANQACVTPHIWLSKKDKLDFPDRMIFDLDPSVDDFSKVKFVAKELKSLLADELGLPVYLMTTGSKGLHVVVPIKRTKTFDEVREFVQMISKYLEQNNPNEITTAARKNKREDKIYMDVVRNAFGQTAVAPYGVRPIEFAPVATPIEWEELDKLSSSQHYTIKTIFQRLAQKEDPWKDIDKHTVTLDRAMKRFNAISQYGDLALK